MPAAAGCSWRPSRSGGLRWVRRMRVASRSRSPRAAGLVGLPEALAEAEPGRPGCPGRRRTGHPPRRPHRRMWPARDGRASCPSASRSRTGPPGPGTPPGTGAPTRAGPDRGAPRRSHPAPRSVLAGPPSRPRAPAPRRSAGTARRSRPGRSPPAASRPRGRVSFLQPPRRVVVGHRVQEGLLLLLGHPVGAGHHRLPRHRLVLHRLRDARDGIFAPPGVRRNRF